ncbi:MAG: VCBS repeat-containing protein [Chitinophagales bacterium]
MKTSKTALQLLLLFLIGMTWNACAEKEERHLFRCIPSSKSGITFYNNITETPNFNILNFHYIYNGGGVGIGDFDKNGLPDLVFSGNQVASKIYLNKDKLQFKDITEEANFHPKGWATGVSIIDLNADGWQDIYISVGGLQCEGNCKNQLFIHQGLNKDGIPHFKEMAAEYGLDDGLYTQQAAFFDYDSDGDLDVYLLHNVIDKRDKSVPSDQKFINEKSKDQLLENLGFEVTSPKRSEEGVISKPNKANPKPFKDVSDSLGITHRGYGLGITLNDFNEDNLPDLYIANDFLSNDLLYLNKGIENGKHLGFEEVSQQKLKHTSYNAMGVDVADINGDALPDIFVLDMLPEYNERQKTMLGFMNYNKFLLTLRQKYTPQFIRNTLQIHNGFFGNELLPFSEVGYLSGVYNTDWSWTPLLADFDNDGDRDLFVTNGYGKDITDLDFINYSQQRSPFGTKESQEKELYDVVEKMHPIKMPNYIFENQGSLKFQNQSGNWLKKQNSISNGAVYADLDQDGDLDLIVNNIDETAYILENQSSNKEETKKNNFLKIQLQGAQQNPTAIGTRIQIWAEGNTHTHFQSTVRGYLSSVDDMVHFGLGKATTVDSMKVFWQNGQISFLKDIEANQTLQINMETVIQTASIAAKSSKPSHTIFTQTSNFTNYKHKENPYSDFDAQPLLMHQHSRQGPCIVAANIDGKAGDEVFIGGAKGFPSQIFYQNENREYLPKDLPNPEHEDTDAVFFDFDQDGDLDLYVVSGGVEFKENAPEYQDRLYLNDGKGNFAQNPNISIPAKTSGSCVIPNDFDQDGDIDLFIGGRVHPRKYPQNPRSYLLLNHNGRFLDYTNKLAYSLENIGMVTDAVWSDYDGDGWDDLIIVGEWMPITIFKNEQGHFTNHQLPVTNYKGLWNCITAADIDQDGDPDYLLGNLGENSRLKASIEEPLALYTKDFDGNGSLDPLIGQFFSNKAGERKSYPIHSRDDVMKQIVKVKSRYVKYAEFGEVTFPELMQSELDSGDYLQVNHLQSSYLENKGNGEFELKPLPQAAQIAPIQDFLVEDFNGDGHLDALLSGNNFTSESNNGWYDAFNGLLLQGDGKGNFEAIPTSKSGFYVPFDGRDIIQIKDRNGQKTILVGQNSNGLIEHGFN